MEKIRIDELPNELRIKIQNDEDPYHFSYVARKGGCLSPGKPRQWILVTNKRILFEASLLTTEIGIIGKYTHQSGTIPIHKISFVSTEQTNEAAPGCGCSPVKVFRLCIK